MSVRSIIDKAQNNTFIKAVIDFFGRSSQNHIPAYSAQSSFFIVISMVPFTMLLVSILRLFIPIQQSALENFVNNFLPQQVNDFSMKIIDELYSNVSFSVVSITTIALLWSASRGVNSIVTGLQNIYGITRPTDFLLNIVFSILYTLIFIVILILTVIILVFGRQLNSLLFSDFTVVQQIITTLLGMRNILLLLPLTLFFSLSYKFLAKNGIKFAAHLPGAFLSALGWMLFSFFFALYVDNFANYPYIYGSLTAIILLMLWLYACMTIFLLGAQLNVILYEKRLPKFIYKRRKNKNENEKTEKV